ncbi:MAG: Coenzyme F420 hydrogenase/dehydrogenase, beta subunit C-terminal domain, partial [Chloroflexota bacterium]
EALLLAACPGVIGEPRVIDDDGCTDPIWGHHSDMRYAWAGDADIRFRAATGGVLTALGVYLLKSGRVDFILHVGADPERPMRNRWVISETVESVIQNAGSRYSPAAPLAGLEIALKRNQPFALIGKPCDLGAVHRLATQDPRVNRLCKYRLTMVCGGQSRLKKSSDLIETWGLSEEEISLFRYRGYGNPGRTRIETRDGKAFELTYTELWEDEGKWEIESRCKLCPDALGEAADVAAADVWPGGGPSGEDAGFNGIIIRSKIGGELVAAAAEAGELILGEEISSQEFNQFQPHQVRKKEALAARYAGLLACEMPVIATPGLRLEALGGRLSKEKWEQEKAGTVRRARSGRFSEKRDE